MKKFYFLLVAAVALTFISCDNNKEPEQPAVIEVSGSTFVGTFGVQMPDETTYEMPDAQIVINKSESVEGKYDIVMKQVKFAEAMPSMDITAPGVTIEDGKISGNGIVPLAFGGPFERYMINDLTGEITYSDQTPQTLSMECLCGPYPLSYKGVYQK